MYVHNLEKMSLIFDAPKVSTDKYEEKTGSSGTNKEFSLVVKKQTGELYPMSILFSLTLKLFFQREGVTMVFVL